MKILRPAPFLIFLLLAPFLLSASAHALEPRPFDESSNYYEVIGATREMTSDEIAAAWKKAITKYHPDRAQNDADREQYNAATTRIIEAGRVLKNAERRASYDQTLRTQGHRPVSNPYPVSTGPSETEKERTARIERATFLTLQRDLFNMSREPGLIAQKIRVILDKRFPLPSLNTTLFIGGSHAAHSRAMIKFINDNFLQAVAELNHTSVSEELAVDLLHGLARWPYEPPFNYDYERLVLQHYNFQTREVFLSWSFRAFRHLADDGSETREFESWITANLNRLYEDGTDLSSLYLDFAEMSVIEMKGKFPFISTSTFELLISTILAHPTLQAVQALQKLATIKSIKAKAKQALAQLRAENPSLQDNSLFAKCRRFLGGS